MSFIYEMKQYNMEADLYIAFGTGSFRAADVDSVTAAVVAVVVMVIVLSAWNEIAFQPPTGTWFQILTITDCGANSAKNYK